MASTDSYTLYYNRWSICSQMVQLTLAFGSSSKGAQSAMTVEQKEVDIMHSEQLEDTYLTEINAKGQISLFMYVYPDSQVD